MAVSCRAIKMISHLYKHLIAYPSLHYIHADRTRNTQLSSSWSRMKEVEESERQNRLYRCPNVNQSAYVIWVFQERVWDCICNQRWQARYEDQRRTSSIVACTILDPAHIPESEKDRGQWSDAGNLVFGVLLLKEEKVEHKCDPWCGMQSEVNPKGYSHQR